MITYEYDTRIPPPATELRYAHMKPLTDAFERVVRGICIYIYIYLCNTGTGILTAGCADMLGNDT